MDPVRRLRKDSCAVLMITATSAGAQRDGQAAGESHRWREDDNARAS
jgi:hypothetical protein